MLHRPLYQVHQISGDVVAAGSIAAAVGDSRHIQVHRHRLVGHTQVARKQVGHNLDLEEGKLAVADNRLHSAAEGIGYHHIHHCSNHLSFPSIC